VYYTPPLPDGHLVEVHHYFPKNPGTHGTPTQPGTDSPLPLPPLTPAILHMHGGGMIMSSVAESRAMLERYVAETKVPFFAVAYRLAPEHPHPTPVGDCYAAEVGVDRARI
jgi:acetyl esterase/lipase